MLRRFGFDFPDGDGGVGKEYREELDAPRSERVNDVSPAFPLPFPL